MMYLTSMTDNRFEFAPNYKTQLYRREIQLLINIQQPDPEYQPILITDRSIIFDIVTANEKIIRDRFSDYFEQPFSYNLSQPLWKLIEEIRLRQPDWPG